jgi:uncharacterized membrane protein (GlpM family)
MTTSKGDIDTLESQSRRFDVMLAFTKGALWGILPSVFFFLAAFFCFKRQLALPVVLGISFAIWLTGAFVHQWFLK